jgi:GDP-L-fucose synthase
MVGGRMMIEQRPLAVADDLAIDASFWQWAARCMPRQCVSFSSSAAYPINLQREEAHVLLREDMIDFQARLGMPDMSYGWAKLTSEYLGRLAHEKHGVQSICFRPFSGYGEDQDMAYPFPSICQRVLDNKGAPEIDIWGSGRQMRDFIHIDDCIEGIMRMKDSIVDGGAVNLSTGEYTSFIDLTLSAAELVGYRPHVHPLSDRPEGVFARGGDTEKQKTFGFAASISLHDGLSRAMNYLTQNRVVPA